MRNCKKKHNWYLNLPGTPPSSVTCKTCGVVQEPKQEVNQKTDNEKWLQTIEGKGGLPTLGILVPPKVETKLPRPYQFELSIAEIRKLVADLKDIADRSEASLQHVLIRTRAIKYGIRFEVWALSHCTKTDQERWVSLTGKVIERIKADLPKACVYVEPWNNERKFQLRFETYIRYKEMAP